MNKIELEIALNSLDATSKDVIKKMYYHYCPNTYSNTNGSNDCIPVKPVRYPMAVCNLSPNWRTHESMDSILTKLVDTGIITRDVQSKITFTTSITDEIHFNDACVDTGYNMLEIIKDWVNTPTLEDLVNRARSHALSTEIAQKVVADRLYALIPDNCIPSSINVILEDQAMCEIQWSTPIRNESMRLPLAIVDSADPIAAYAEIKKLNGERKTKMQP
jgi:hypothetical protein